MKRTVIFWILLSLSAISYGQINRYIVHFTDKNNSPFRIDNPQEFLSSRAIERRAKHGVPITEQDLPVNPAYIQELKDLGVDVYFTSKWFNAVLVEVDESDVGQIADLDFVELIELVARGEKLGDGSGGRRKDKNIKFKESILDTSLQNMMLGIDQMHKEGYKGEEVLVGVFDGGFINVDEISFFGHLFSSDKLKHTFSYVDNSAEVFQYSDHGTRVLSTMAGYQSGSFTGTIPNADYMLFVTEDVFSEQRIEEYNWAFAAEFSDSAGVDLINTSLGYSTFQVASMNYSKDDMDGNTAVITRAAEIAASKGILLVNSAGNEGNTFWKIITAPADAVNVLSVGSVSVDGTVSSFSSTGPTADGRLKPDLVALGSGTTVISGSGNVTNSGGTSFSAPLITGLAAGIIQANPTLKASEIIEYLKSSASNATTPNNEMGYGVPNYQAFKNIRDAESQKANFIVFPNPMEDRNLNITTNDPTEFSNVSMKIFTASGQVIADTKLIFTWLNISNSITLLNLPAGVYIIQLTTKGFTEQFRIVKL